MDALRASIDSEKKKAPAPSVQARRPAKKKAGQKWVDRNLGRLRMSQYTIDMIGRTVALAVSVACGLIGAHLLVLALSLW